MTIFDVLFLVSVLGCVLALVAALVALVFHRRLAARRLALTLGSYLLLYALTLASVGALSPQQTMVIGQTRCFDDWCIAVAHAVQRSSLDASPTLAPNGRFTIVTVRVSSRAKRISQRELDTQLYLVDGAGRRYDVAAAAQRALDAAGQGGQPLTTELAPGASFTHTVAFDTPIGASRLALIVTHSAFPGALIIGSDQSPFHRPTLMLLSGVA